MGALLIRLCWFCGAENPASRTICSFCNHHRDG